MNKKTDTVRLCARPPTVWLVVTSPQVKSGEASATTKLFGVGKNQVCKTY